MNVAKTKTLFFYGTLRDEAVREAVIGTQGKKMNLIDGYLKGYKLFKVKNANYPLILRDLSSKSRINGLIAMDLDKQIIRKLDIFEGENYSRTKASAFRACDNIEINLEIYMPKKCLQFTEEWIFEDWCKFQKKFFFEKDFDANGVRSPN